MKRQDKYPDTCTFHFHNENPRNKYTGDCVVRALATALNQSYETTLKELIEYHLCTGYEYADAKCFGKYLEDRGWVKQKQPRKLDNTKYTGKEFCQFIQKHNNPHSILTSFKGITWAHQMIANIGGNHTVAIIEGQVYDTWDSTDGCVGNYWVPYKR